MSDVDLMVDMPNVACWPRKSADSLCSLISRGNAPVYVEKSEIRAIGQRCVSAKGFIEKHARPHSESAVNGALQPESGDVLLNSTGTGTIGRSVVFSSPGRFIVDGHVTVMRPRPGIADARWLNAVLQAPFSQRHLERFCYSGSTNQLELNRTPLRLSHFPAPSFEEQERIGQVIDTLDAAIHETEALIAKLKAVKQGLLHDLLTRGIDTNGELRSPRSEAPHLYKQSPVGWIPLEWNAPMVTEIAEVLSGATPARTQAARYFSFEGIPWVKTLDLNEDEILATEERITAAALRETSCTLLPEGAVLVAMYGGWQQIGRAAMLGTAAATNQAISALVMRSDEAVPEFVLRALQHGRSRWQGVAASTRKDPNITKADVVAFRVPWPSIKEQAEIVRRFKCLLARLGSESATLVKMRREKFGLMDDLLAGRVRVTPLLDTAPA